MFTVKINILPSGVVSDFNVVTYYYACLMSITKMWFRASTHKNMKARCVKRLK